MMALILFVTVVLCLALMLNGAENNETSSFSAKLASCTITEYVLALQDDCKFGYDTIHGLWYVLSTYVMYIRTCVNKLSDLIVYFLGRTLHRPAQPVLPKSFRSQSFHLLLSVI